MNQKGSVRGTSEDGIYSGALPFKKERLLLFGEKSLTCVDQSQNTIWKAKLGDDILTAAAITKSDLTVAAVLNGEVLNREKRQITSVKFLNSKGTVAAQTEIDALITDIKTLGRCIACTAGSEIFFLNDKGEIMDRYTSRFSITSVFLAKEDLAYVVSGGTVTRVRLTVTNKFLGIF